MIKSLGQFDIVSLFRKNIVVFEILLCGVFFTMIMIGGNLMSTINAIPSANFNISEVYNLSNNHNDSVYGQVDSHDKNNLSLVWQDSNFKNRDPNLIDRNYDVYYQNFNIDNFAKNARLNLSNNSGFSEHPHMAVSGNNTFITWVDNSGGIKQVYFRASEDGGNAFNNPIILSSNESEAYSVDVSADANDVYITWQQESANGTSIVIKTSDDFGSTFGDEKILANHGSDSYPRVLTQNGTVYVTWNTDLSKGSEKQGKNLTSGAVTNPGIYFTLSNDRGATFSTPKLLSDPSSFSFGKSQISAYDNYVYVTWIQKNTPMTFGNLFVAKSSDFGHNFETSKIPLVASGMYDASNLDTFAFGDKLFLAIEASLNSNSTLMSSSTLASELNKEIFFTVITQNQTSFHKFVNLSQNKGISECPSISVTSDENLASVSWEDYTPGNHEIFMRQIHY